MAESTFNLNMHTHRLLEDEPFFAALSRRIDKRATTSIPTAGVRINPDTAQFEMVYNPDFMRKIIEDCTEVNPENPYRWVRGVLMHEFYHIVYGHLTDRLPGEGKMTQKWNIAFDLAINTHIPDELPPMALVPGRADTQFAEFPPGLSGEAYFKMLSNDDDGEGDGDGGGGGEDGDGDSGAGDSGESSDSSGGSGGSGEPQTLDDHSGWGDCDATTQEIAKERAKQMIRKAAEEAAGRGWGSISASCKRDIMNSLETKVDWRAVLRYFVKASQRAAKRSTVKRINKRFPYIHAGRRTERTAKVAVSIDQSGSVSDGMLSAFFAELNKLAQYAEFTVVPFDDKVFEDKVYVWKKGDSRKRERVLCGGTDFNAPTKYVNEHKFDGHLVLTDMYAPKPGSSKCQRMWMTTKSCAQHPYFETSERVLAIDE